MQRAERGKGEQSAVEQRLFFLNRGREIVGECDVFAGKRQRVRRALNRPARERLRDMNHRIAVIHLFAQANGFVRRAQIRHALEKRGNDRAFGKVFSIRAP